jgi:hypothetical protein
MQEKRSATLKLDERAACPGGVVRAESSGSPDSGAAQADRPFVSGRQENQANGHALVERFMHGAESFWASISH